MQKNPLLVIVGRGLIALLFLFVFVSTSISQAQTAANEAPVAEPSAVNPSPPAANDSWGDKAPPEGYVQSKAPTQSDSPYNFVQMGYAGVIMVLMGGLIVWLIKRNTRDKDVSRVRE